MNLKTYTVTFTNGMSLNVKAKTSNAAWCTARKQTGNPVRNVSECKSNDWLFGTVALVSFACVVMLACVQLMGLNP